MNELFKQNRAFPHFEISVAVGYRLENSDENLGLVKLI